MHLSLNEQFCTQNAYSLIIRLYITEVLRNGLVQSNDFVANVMTYNNVVVAAELIDGVTWYTMAFIGTGVTLKVNVANSILKITTVIPGDSTISFKGKLIDNLNSLFEC